MSAQGNCTTDASHCHLYIVFVKHLDDMHSTHLRMSMLVPQHNCDIGVQNPSKDCLYVRTEQQHYEQATAKTVAWLSDYPYRSTSVYVTCRADIQSLAADASHAFAHMQSRLNVSCCCFGHAVVVKMHANHCTQYMAAVRSYMSCMCCTASQAWIFALYVNHTNSMQGYSWYPL